MNSSPERPLPKCPIFSKKGLLYITSWKGLAKPRAHNIYLKEDRPAAIILRLNATLTSEMLEKRIFIEVRQRGDPAVRYITQNYTWVTFGRRAGERQGELEALTLAS